MVNQLPVFIPEYSPNCNSCHTNNSVITLHSDPKVNVGCKTCHYTAPYKPAVVSLNADCRGCHDKSVNPAMDMTATHDNFHTVNVAVYQESAGCLSCHKADSVNASVYTVYSSVYNLLPVHQKKPAYTKVANCDACHGAAARTEVKQAIAANNVNCTACHAGGTSAGHAHNISTTGYESNPVVDCASCHATDPVARTSELAKIHQDGLGARYSCSVCHNATYEGSVIVKDGKLDMLKNGAAPIYCNDCHGVTSKAPAKHTDYVPHGSARGFGPVNTLDGGSCSLCHTSLDIDNAHTRSVGGNNCNACHTNANGKGITATAVISANLST
ncbi:hypothetical protein FDZ74_15965, partial [bacterium]